MITRVLFFLSFACIGLSGCTPPASDAPSLDREKRIALTYDDAPLGAGPMFSGKERTRALIAQLDTVKTGPVAMFVTTGGFDSPGGRERVKAYADAGHLIANHSHSHMWAGRVTAEAYIADIDLAEKNLTGFKHRRAWYRFPYLDEGAQGRDEPDFEKRDRLRRALSARSLKNGYVTVDTYDWHLDRLWQAAVKNGEYVDMQALSKVYSDMILDAANHYDDMAKTVLGRRPAHVLLLHENDLAARFTIDAVKALRADGWIIIHPDEAFADPLADLIPETGFSGQGRLAALAADAGLMGAEVYTHWSADKDGIESKLAEAGVFGESTLK